MVLVRCSCHGGVREIGLRRAMLGTSAFRENEIPQISQVQAKAGDPSRPPNPEKTFRFSILQRKPARRSLSSASTLNSGQHLERNQPS